MLIRGQTSRLPGHKEARCISGSVISSTNTNFAFFDFQSSHEDNWLLQPSVHSDVASNSSMSALPIIVSQKSPIIKYDYKA